METKKSQPNSRIAADFAAYSATVHARYTAEIAAGYPKSYTTAQVARAEKNRRLRDKAEQRVWDAAEAAKAARYNIQERNEDAE